MSLRQIVERQQSLNLRPGLTDEELREFSSALPGPLSIDLENLLRFASGFQTKALGIVDFTGRSHPTDFKEFVPYGFAVAKTIEGNFGLVDIQQDGTWGHVFYISHDPPIFLLHFNSFVDFLESAIREDRIIKEAASVITQDHIRGVLAAEARNHSDAKMTQFAHTLSDNFRIYDLRNLQSPQGFEWGHNGAWTQCKRFHLDLIFAVETFEPRKGFLCGGRSINPTC